MTEEIDTIKTLIQGLQTRVVDLGNVRDIFLKAQGLDEQIEKERQKIGEYEADVESVKEELAEKQAQKKDAVRTTMLEITKEMNKIIPDGDGCIQIDDEGVVVGWFKDDRIRPYDGLSGGEKVIFDAALCFTMLSGAKEKLIVLEGGELDDDNLEKMLTHLSKTVVGKMENTQFIVNTCHEPTEIPKGWDLVNLK